MRRKRHRKRHRKSSEKYIILPAIFLLFLFSVGYSAFSSEFLISGKGTIIEKCIKIGGVAVETVTSGSGLYKSEYEEGRYIYRGASPDNYLTLGEDEYRIISKEADGTLKVIKSEGVGNMVFDPGYDSSITGVTSSLSTEGTRYSSENSNYCYYGMYNGYVLKNYKGCNVWGNNLTMLNTNGNNITLMTLKINYNKYNLPDKESYLNIYLNNSFYNGLSNEVKNVISTHLFNVGLVDKDEVNLTTALSTEKEYKWKGKIGLLSITEYVIADNNSECLSVNDYVNNSACYKSEITTNWIYKDIFSKVSNSWLISPASDYRSGNTFNVEPSLGYMSRVHYTSYHSYAFPVFYLKSDIKLLGSGKSDEPFTLKI